MTGSAIVHYVFAAIAFLIGLLAAVVAWICVLANGDEPDLTSPEPRSRPAKETHQRPRHR